MCRRDFLEKCEDEFLSVSVQKYDIEFEKKVVPFSEIKNEGINGDRDEG